MNNRTLTRLERIRRDRRIFVAWWNRLATQKQLADQFGLSRTQVSTIIRRMRGEVDTNAYRHA